MEWLSTLPGNRQGGEVVAAEVGINGFGCIRRLALKAMTELHGDVPSVVAVSDLTDARTNAHLSSAPTSRAILPVVFSTP